MPISTLFLVLPLRRGVDDEDRLSLQLRKIKDIIGFLRRLEGIKRRHGGSCEGARDWVHSTRQS